MPSRRATAAVAAVLGVLAAGAGCGGDGTDRVARDGVVRVTLREFRIDPQDWEVPAGRVELVATNRGRLSHNLALERAGGAADEPPPDLARSRPALPGETVRITATLRPGTYRIASTLSNQDNLGMWGTLRVVGR